MAISFYKKRTNQQRNLKSLVLLYSSVRQRWIDIRDNKPYAGDLEDTEELDP